MKHGKYDCTAYCSRFLARKIPEIIECVGEFANSLLSNGGDVDQVTAKFVTFVGSGEYDIRQPPPQLYLIQRRMSWPRYSAFKLGKFWAHMNPQQRDISTREQFVEAVSDLGFNAVIINAYLLKGDGWIPRCLGENVFSVYKTKCCDIAFRCVYAPILEVDAEGHGSYYMVGSITEKTVTENRGVQRYLSGKYKKGIHRNALQTMGSELFAQMEERQLDDAARYEEDMSRVAPTGGRPAPTTYHHQKTDDCRISKHKRERDRINIQKATKNVEERIARDLPSWSRKKRKRRKEAAPQESEARVHRVPSWRRRWR